jgi:hypothetical protein
MPAIAAKVTTDLVKVVVDWGVKCSAVTTVFLAGGAGQSEVDLGKRQALKKQQWTTCK